MRVMCDTARSARLAVLGVPVALEVVDQGWAVEAVGLLTGVIAHVAAEQVERFLDLSQGQAVGGEAGRPGAHDLGCGTPDRRLHLAHGNHLVGERAARQALFFNRSFPADSPGGRQLADAVLPADEVDEAIRSAAAEVVSAGTTSLVANRQALRKGQEPLDLFRRYMSSYAREQARCLYSPALIDNLERNWNARERAR